jgi:hypothetical protein
MLACLALTRHRFLARRLVAREPDTGWDQLPRGGPSVAPIAAGGGTDETDRLRPPRSNSTASTRLSGKVRSTSRTVTPDRDAPVNLLIDHTKLIAIHKMEG